MLGAGTMSHHYCEYENDNGRELELECELRGADREMARYEERIGMLQADLNNANAKIHELEEHVEKLNARCGDLVEVAAALINDLEDVLPSDVIKNSFDVARYYGLFMAYVAQNLVKLRELMRG
jgi:septal ring factor EnvC (AmiA/AmiB activator)